MKKIVIKAEKRKEMGRKVRALRRAGKTPTNVYGSGVKSLALTVDTKEFENVYKEAGETSLVELLIGKEKRAVLISNVQTDPVSDEVIHVDFRQVDLKKKITATVPVVLIGEASAEKEGLGTLVQQVMEVEVEALPADLPEKLEADVSKIKSLEDTVTVADLKTGSKVEIKDALDNIVAKVEETRKEEEVVPEVVEGEEEEAVEGEEKKEGEESKESEEKKEEGKGEASEPKA